MPPSRVVGVTWTTYPSGEGGLQKRGRTPTSISWKWKVWIACQRFEESLRGKTVSFQIDNTTAVAYLLKNCSTHCKTLNCLVRKILLKCHWNGIMVCSEYYKGMANLWADALSRNKKAQGWSLGYPAWHATGCSNAGKPQWLTSLQGIWLTRYPSISAWISQTREHLGEMPWRRGSQGAFGVLFHLQSSPKWPWMASKMGTGPDHNHTLLTRSELVHRDLASSNRATKEGSDYHSSSYGIPQPRIQFQRSWKAFKWLEE